MLLIIAVLSERPPRMSRRMQALYVIKAVELGTAIKETLLQLGIHIVFTRGLYNDAFKC